MESKETNGPDIAEPHRPSAEQMDEFRYQQMAQEYLCRLREAREWIQICLDDKLPPLIEFEDSLRNGVILARLAHFVAPKIVQSKDIFDSDQNHYQEVGLHFRHTDNVSRFLKMADVVGLPKVFYPEIVDIYDKKNMPKAVYCVHALSIYLQKRFGNKFPPMNNVSANTSFADEDISAMAKELAKYDLTIPAFGNIGGLLADEDVIQRANAQCDEEKNREEAATKIQRDEAARRIQTFYRKRKPEHDYHTLMNSPNPSLYIVQRFANLLNETDIDYEEELEIERLRKAIREEIRLHKKYEKQLDELDLQIGLLVRNRINLEMQAKHVDERGPRQSGSSKRGSITDLNNEGRGFGFDLLTKPGRQRLHAYQNLLFFLTRNPKYLSELLILSASSSDQFMESITMPLFNYGAGSYDEYLLMRFFKAAMEEEIDQKVAHLADMQDASFVSVVQVLKYTMNSHGDEYKPIFQQLLTSLLAVKDSMDTNPVDVYRSWIEELETQSGQPSGLPVLLNNEQALVHPEVKERLHESIIALKNWVGDFLDAILKNKEKMPYSVRYSCKALCAKLEQKFPQERPKSIMKIVADVMLYRFIQSCILARSTERGGLPEDDARAKRQKQATVNVSRLLRAVMVNKGYNDEHPYLIEFNDFIKDCHQRFKSFFDSLCDVPELEEYFEVDEYIDYVTITKSATIIQMGDLIKLHQILVDNRSKIAGDLSDPLHELLNDFGGGPPSISDIVGDVDESTRARAESTELVLTLTNKFEGPGDSSDMLRHEFLRTKKYLVDIILVQRASSVVDLLKMPVSETDEVKHKDILDSRRRDDQETTDRLTLVEKKAAALVGLATLEEAGLVSRENDYRDIIAAIAQDIRTRSRYRESRTKDRARLLATLEKLKNKSKLYREQIDFYDAYLRACLHNMQTPMRKRDSLKRRSVDQGMPPTVIKYTATALADKGVLSSIDNGPRDSYKHIHFEIKNTADPGVFEMSTKFLGASDFQLEEIVLQKLLQLQFENIPTVMFFGKVKFNVAPLIALLNKKFFAKHK